LFLNPWRHFYIAAVCVPSRLKVDDLPFDGFDVGLRAGNLPPKIGPLFKLGLGYNIRDHIRGGHDESEAIYGGADYRIAQGSG
jgi:hypothetical protein